MKHLYISDLDGTLLTPAATVSPRTGELMTALIEAGLCFTVSTARSPFSVRMVGLEKIPLRLPVSLLNGVMLYDLNADKVLSAVPLPEVDEVVALCAAAGKSPLVFRVEDGVLIVDYTVAETPEEQEFLEARRSRFPQNYRRLERHTKGKEAVFVSVQDRFEVLQPVYEVLCRRDAWHVSFYKDGYTADTWFLEVSGKDGGKGSSLLRLKALVGADKVTAFGDNHNDLPMLRVADEAIAVRNATDEVKAAAQQVIGANTEDGVAEYLKGVFIL